MEAVARAVGVTAADDDGDAPVVSEAVAVCEVVASLELLPVKEAVCVAVTEAEAPIDLEPVVEPVSDTVGV